MRNFRQTFGRAAGVLKQFYGFEHNVRHAARFGYLGELRYLQPGECIANQRAKQAVRDELQTWCAVACKARERHDHVGVENQAATREFVLVMTHQSCGGHQNARVFLSSVDSSGELAEDKRRFAAARPAANESHGIN